MDFKAAHIAIKEKLFGPANLRVFVYGTLKKGYVNYDRYCSKAVDVTPCMIRGRMYSQGIPFVTVADCDVYDVGTLDYQDDVRTQEKHGKPRHDLSSPVVYGDLIEFEDTSPIRDMDYLEGYDPMGYYFNMYERVLVPVYPEGKTPTFAWMYRSGMPVSETYRVMDGSWPTPEDFRLYNVRGIY